MPAPDCWARIKNYSGTRNIKIGLRLSSSSSSVRHQQQPKKEILLLLLLAVVFCFRTMDDGGNTVESAGAAEPSTAVATTAKNVINFILIYIILHILL